MVTLPPEISVEKRRLSDGIWAYEFRHRTLGLLGRIEARGTADGQTLLVLEIAGDTADPMTEKRQRIFEPIGREIMAEMERRTGPGTGPIPDMPPAANDAGMWLENKLLQCNRCDAFVGRLVFAPKATDQSRFEDYARMLFPTFREFDVPTWIIGPMLGHGPEAERPADIMRVWPVRGAIRRLRPAEFNPEIDAIQEAHCLPDQAERRRRERRKRGPGRL